MKKDERLYARFDIGMDEHPKIMLLSDAAFRALIEVTFYARRQMTDGFIDERVAIRKWGIEVIEELANNHAERPSLLRVDGGWQVRDYAEHQTTRADIEAKREAGRLGGLAKAGKLVAPASEALEQKAGESLAKTETETDSKTDVKSTRGARLSPDWKPSTELAAWAVAKRPDLNVLEQVEAFRDYWKSAPGSKGVKLDWDATFRSWIRNAYASKVPDTSKPTVSGVVTPTECVKHPYYPAHDCAKCVEEAAEEFRRLDASNGREGEAA